MSHSLPKKDRNTRPPQLPTELSQAMSAVQQDPFNLEHWDALNEVCRTLERPDEVAALYVQALEGKLSDAAISGANLESLGRLAADFCEEWYEDTSHVLGMLGRVLESDPSQQWAFERITLLLTAAGRWDELLETYDVALRSASDPLKRQDLYEEAAKIARDFAAQHDRASLYLKQLLLLRLDDDQLAAATERRFEEQGRHADLIEVWTARIAVLDRTLALKTRFAIASRYFEHLRDSDLALASLDQFMDAGGDEAAACQLLERISDFEGGPVPPRRAALSRLDQLYTRANNPALVLSVAERALLLSDNDDERVALYRKALNLCVQGGQLEHAMAHGSALLKIQPEAEDVRQQMRAIAEQVGHLDRYCDAMVAAADAALVPERRIELLVDAAEVRASHLGDIGSAISLYYRVETDEAPDEEVRLLACKRLSSLLESTERYNELLPVLERWAKLEPSSQVRRVTLGRAAHLARSLEQYDRSLGLWALCLRELEKDDEALSQRVELLVQLDRPAELVLELGARSLVGDDPRRQRDDLIFAAHLYRDRLADLASAIAAYRSVEQRFGRNSETIDALSALLNQAQDHPALVELLNDAIAKESDELRATSQLTLLGDTLRLHLRDNSGALVAYARALSLDCQSAGARSGLVALLEEKDLAHQAGEHLVRAYRSAQEDDLIVELAEQRIASAPSLSFKSEILLEVASLHERRQDLAAALVALRRAFALVPSAATETELHRVASLTKQWSVVDLAYAEAIVQCQDPERLCSLYLMKGNTERLHLSDSSAATASYVAALEREPARADIARLLIESAHQAKLYAQAAWAIIENSRKSDAVAVELLDTFAQCAQAHGDWDGVLEGMADQIANAGEMSAQVAHDIKKQLAVWYRDQLSDPDSAELVLKRAVMDLPERDTVAMLADLQRRSPSRALVATLCLLSEKSQDDLVVLREAAHVALEAVADAELARPILERAFSGSSQRLELQRPPEDAMLAEINDWCTDRLVELALLQKDFARGVQLLKGSAALPFAACKQIERLYQAATVARDGRLDAEAVELCEEVLSREPSHEAAIGLLSSLHAEAGRLEQLLLLRKRELALERPLERRLFLRLDMARVLGELDKPAEQRLLVLRENLIDRPGHAETIEALDAILTGLADYSALVRLYEEQADAVSGTMPEHAARLWERAGLFAEQYLAEEARLASAFKKSAALVPSIFVVDRLAQLAHAQEKWEEEVSWLTLRLGLTAPAKEAPDRRAVVVALGQALVKTDEWAIAAGTLEGELSADPGADEGRQLLARIYRELNEWEKLSELLEQGVEFAPDDTTRVNYLRDAAVVHRKHLGQTEAAIPLLEEAIARDPQDRGLKLMLADTLRTCERFEEGREILRAMLEEFGRRRTRERAMVHMQLARIAEALGELDEAVEQADAAANIERSDAAILMLVGGLARRKGELDRAEKAYRTLALLAGRRSAQSAVQSLEEVGESAILFELHRIAAEKGETQQARELIDSAITVATRDESEALRLAQSLVGSQQLDLLFAALQLGIDNGVKGAAAAHLLLIKANVLEQCDRGEEAFAARLQALSEAPSDLRLLDGTQKLAERLGLDRQLWGHVTGLALRTADQPSVAGELWFRAGQAAEAEGELGRAAECYEYSQQSGFKPRRAFQALDTVLDEATEPERVRRALSTFIQAQGAEANAGVYAEALYRLADMELGHAQVDAATELLLRAIEIDSQAERVVAMLEPIVREGIANAKVTRLFLAVCKKAASEGLQMYAYEQALALAGIEPSVATEAIALARRVDDKQKLRDFISRAIELAPVGDVAIADLLVERAGMARADGDLALEAALLERATAYFEGQNLYELKLRLASCYREQELPHKALAILEELFETTPGEGRVWRPLLSIYRATNATAEIEQVIEQIADEVSDAADLEALKVERVHLMVRDGRSREAESELRAVLEKHPQMSDAAALLVEILRSEQRLDELLDVLRTLLDQARRLGQAKLVAQYGLELAKLLESTDRGEAISLLVADLGLTKSEHELLAYLLSLYTDEDDQSERADIMEHLIAASPLKLVKERTLWLVDLRTRLDDQFGAGRALEIGVRTAPGDEELVGLLIDHLRNSGEHGALAEALLVRARQLSGEPAAQCYVEAGNILEAYLGDPARAAEAYQLAYAADPSSATHLLKAVTLLVSCGEIDVALTKLSSAIERCQELLLVDLLQLRASILAREKSGDRQAMIQAAGDLARALQQFIAEQQEQEIQQLRIQVLRELRILHQNAADVAQEREVAGELADLLLALGQTSEGLDVLASWLRDHGDDRRIAMRLGERAMSENAADIAMFAYEKLVESSSGAEKTSALLSLSEAAQMASDMQVARMALEDALALEPQNFHVLERLRAMYAEVGAFAELAGILQAEVEKQHDSSAKFTLLMQVGDLYLKAGDEQQAIEVLHAALELNVNNSGVVARLAQIHVVQGDTALARQMLDEAIKEHGKRRSPELALLQHAMAGVEEAEENLDAMFAWLEAALISDRNNAEIASELAVRAQAAERYEVAVKALQNLALNKTDAGMSKAEAYFRQAQIAAIVGDEKKALLMARRAHATDNDLPGLSELLRTLGG